MEETIVNKVAKAQIEQIDLKDFVNKDQLLGIDVKELLWEELVLKEKEFRTWVKEHDWQQYTNQLVQVYCSNDAIIPAWAYMLITTQLENAKQVFFGDEEAVLEDVFFYNLNAWDVQHLEDKRVMVKGCSSIPNPQKAYVELTKKLMPVAKNLMFGEPCSAVPVFKRKG
jgi:hypothetical protein